MLQRAASNAYSWWWASHIRTKQSKWLEQNLQDMEDKVQNVLKLIEEDGDSFAKRAEMYYKKRPELIVFVEESYRAYRALAERYDHISTELQNANNTIASVFPEQVQFAMEDDDDFSPRVRPPPEIMRPNIPKVPKAPIKDLKSLLASSVKKLKNNKEVKKSAAATVPKSGLTKEEALKRIDKVQKDILALQTVKEFVKSSYEGGLARYWEIEKQIKEMQEEVSKLQDEFGEGMVIEDDEARKLMAAAALRSCQETLSQLQEKQRKSTEEVLLERERTKNSWNKYKSLKKEILPGVIDEKIYEITAGIEKMSQEDGEKHNKEELGSLGEKIEEHFEAEFSATSLTVTEMAEKIDELVEKVISLETAFSSQTALVKRLRAENNNLQAQIQALEDDKAKIMNAPKKTVQNKMKQMEEKLHGIHVLNQSVKDQNNNLQTHFKEANLNLEHLSEKLNCIKSDEEEEIASLPFEAAVDKAKGNLQLENKREEKHNPGDNLQQSPDEQKHSNLHRGTEASSQSQKNSMTSSEVVLLEESGQTLPNEEHVACNQVGERRAQVVSDAFVSTQGNRCHCQKAQDTGTSGKCEDPQLQDEADSKSSSSLPKDDHSQVEEQGDGIDQEEPDWRGLFLKGMENREKTLLMEYTTVLRNFKEMKKKLSEVERKDEEILSLRKKVSLLQMVLDERKDSKEPKACNHLQSSQAVIDQPVMPNSPGDPTILLAELDKDHEMGLILVNQYEPTSETEEKLRMDIDQLLEENLEFWLRFSSALNQIQKYETAVEDLRTEVLKLEEKEKNQEGSHSRATQSSFKSEVRPIYKHLKEIHTELSVWTEKCTQLKDEQKSRFSSLCNIQEEITKALKASAEDEEFKFTSYQAAKFQGEVLNMKQENNKVADELQAGLDHLAALQVEVERTLARLNEKLGLPGPKDCQGSQLKQAISRNRVPLRSFIFGVKQKKQRTSIFSSMSPIMNRRYHAMKAGYSV